MSQERRESQVTDEYGRPVAGAEIYVFDQDGNEAELTSDGVTPLSQPVSTDEFGTYSYYAVASLYREDTHYAGKLRYREVTPVGLDGVYPKGPRGGLFFAFDADGNPVAASGTGADAGLRTDLAADTGSLLSKHKLVPQSAVTTYGRSLSQLKALGADDAGGVSVIHFLDPANDAALANGTIATDLTGLFANANTELKARNTASGLKQRLLLGAFKYPVATQLVLDCPSLKIEGRAAKLQTSLGTATSWLVLSAANQTVEGLHLVASTGTSSVAYINVTGVNCRFANDCTIEDEVGGLSGPQLFVREGADNFRMTDSSMKGHKAALDIRANEAIISNVRFLNSGTVGGDDCITVKAIGVGVDGLQVNGCRFENYANFIGIGTQIGTQGVDDPTRAGRTTGGILTNCTGRNCGVIADFKAGTAGTTDYRYGLIEGWRLANLTLYDDLGSKLSGGVSITGGRASLTQDIEAKGIAVHGRTAVGANGYLFTVWCRSVGAAASFKKITLAGSWFDPWLGVANGVGGAPGDPIKGAILVQNDNLGTFEEISFPDVVINGCSGTGAWVDGGMDDAVSFGRLRISNVNTSANGTNGGVAAKSRIRMTSPDVSITFAAGLTAAQSMPYIFPVAGQGDVLCDFLTDEIYLAAQIAVGATPTFYPWRAKRRCQLIEILMMTTDTIAQDATNNLTLTFTNMDGSGGGFGNWSNNTTGATGSRKRSGLTAGVWTSLWHARDVTDNTDKVEGVFIRGGRLQIVKTKTGTEPALNNLRLMIRAAPA